MAIEDNKQLVLSWFEALVTGDAEKAVSLLHDDFRYYYPGDMPCAGWTDKAGFLDSAKMFAGKLAGSIAFRIGEITAEGDRVWFEAESDAPLVDGNRYNNLYVMLVWVRDGRIATFKEFSDTLHTYRVIDGPETRGAPKARESHLERVTNSFGGASLGAALDPSEPKKREPAYPGIP